MSVTHESAIPPIIHTVASLQTLRQLRQETRWSLHCKHVLRLELRNGRNGCRGVKQAICSRCMSLVVVPVYDWVTAVQTAAMAQTRAQASAATPARKRALQLERL